MRFEKIQNKISLILKSEPCDTFENELFILKHFTLALLCNDNNIMGMYTI